MKIGKKAITLMLASAICVLPSFTSCGSDGDKIQLFFDGGGGSGNYNSTRNYDTLEQLAEEWNENNDTYEIVINDVSLNGNRSSITSMLSAKTAPDMLMQVGGVINDDIGNGWYVDLTDYLQKPNPYEEGNVAWKDIYGDGAIAASAGPDGKNYYVCLDNIAIGMVYNMDLLNAAGVTAAPETYSELMDCFKALDAAKKEGKISAEIYMPSGLWYENYLGTSVYGDKVAEMDENGSDTISSYELVKGYKEGEWSIEDERFEEFLRLCYEKSVYYPDNYLGFDVPYKFAKGQLAVTDAVGNMMVSMTKNARFNWAVTGYPRLDCDASEYGGQTVIRGSAGFSSAYWVTNSAIEKGQGAVDACVDFLMFLTASENNSRLVNDLGYALPINVNNSTVSLFDGLKAQYKADQENENNLLWGACYIPELLGTSFNDNYQLAMGDLYEDSEGVKTGDISAVVNTLKGKADDSVQYLIDKYGWSFGE